MSDVVGLVPEEYGQGKYTLFCARNVVVRAGKYAVVFMFVAVGASVEYSRGHMWGVRIGASIFEEYGWCW